MPNLIKQIQEVTPSLPKRLRQCAEYVSNHYDRIAISTVTQLARDAQVQPSAFVRFCQVLGFEGFSDFQRLFREDYRQGRPNYAARLRGLIDITKPHDPNAMLAHLINAGHRSLQSLTDTVDQANFSKACNALCTAEMIHLVGFRRSFPIAAYMSYVFEKLDIRHILHTGMGNLMPKASLGADDALLAISFAPYTEETITLANHAAKHKSNLVAISDNPSSPLADLGGNCLFISEDSVSDFPVPTSTITLAIALAISVGAAKNTQK